MMQNFGLEDLSHVLSRRNLLKYLVRVEMASDWFMRIYRSTFLQNRDMACKLGCRLFLSPQLYIRLTMKIWLVESIQSIHNSLWTWHDKWNICCRYCIYHVEFNVCLVTKPLGVFSSETKWLNASLRVLRIKLCEKCMIKQSLNTVFAWYNELSKPRVCVICLSLRLRQITQTSVLIINY